MSDVWKSIQGVPSPRTCQARERKRVRECGAVCRGRKTSENRPLPSWCLSLAQPRRAFAPQPGNPSSSDFERLASPAGGNGDVWHTRSCSLEVGAHAGRRLHSASKRTGCPSPRRARSSPEAPKRPGRTWSPSQWGHRSLARAQGRQPGQHLMRASP